MLGSLHKSLLLRVTPYRIVDETEQSYIVKKPGWIHQNISHLKTQKQDKRDSSEH